MLAKKLSFCHVSAGEWLAYGNVGITELHWFIYRIWTGLDWLYVAESDLGLSEGFNTLREAKAECRDEYENALALEILDRMASPTITEKEPSS